MLTPFHTVSILTQRIVKKKTGTRLEYVHYKKRIHMFNMDKTKETYRHK
ncbi:hypothetical protein C2W63_02518 [Bacillus velezensis]|nr:hypothetical protein BAMY6614_02270 [Bacillus amyloliquefaciens UMAF6614]RAP18342.1 hypothetical protein C2W63_02518 [Bacillus velezensis]